jgi:phosphopantetheine--protein transferase-like protein
MEEKIREIVSGFIKVPAAQIAESTPIDRTVLKSSILLHRMYARLGEEGVVVNDYAGIKVFGDLISKQGGTISLTTAPVYPQSGESPGASGVGIDIEEVAALPRVADLRKESFYTQNFTPAEIAYCILQADPYSSLTGLFAAKEAIVKADGQYRNRPFNTMEIGHSAEGRPEFPGIGLSISHAGGMAVAVAVRGGASANAQLAHSAPPKAETKPASMAWISWIALVLGAAALVIALKH